MFAPITPTAGIQPLEDYFDADTTQRHPLGFVVDAVDPYWGYGRFMYIKSNDAILKGSLVMWDGSYQGALLPTTAGQGFPFGVAYAPMASGKYGWIQIAGQAVYKTNATVAADTAVAVAAAGIVGTLANGKQLLGVRNLKSATATVTGTANTLTDSSKLFFPGGYDGFELGLALTGTGIPASTVVAKMLSDGKTILMGSAIGTVDKVATATGSITATGTFTGYGVGMLNNPIAQGQVV
jgi:hypothetical protein